ncbi:LytR/AlgR family response regulator transcription factor [Acidihalobacter prosperus]
MRILIADDEAPARMRLRRLVEEAGAGDVIGEAANGRETLEAVERWQPDLVLLDIRMPEGDGLSVARALSVARVPPAVVFVTAHSDRALAALEAGAVAYLVKPVLGERLREALERAGRPTRAQMAALDSAEDHDGSGRAHIGARVGRELRLVPVAEVRYFRAADKSTIAVYKEGEVIVEESLNALEEEFAGDFLRVRRNLLVARAAVRGLRRRSDGHRLLLVSGEQLPVGRRHVKAVKSMLKGVE